MQRTNSRRNIQEKRHGHDWHKNHHPGWLIKEFQKIPSRRNFWRKFRKPIVRVICKSRSTGCYCSSAVVAEVVMGSYNVGLIFLDLIIWLMTQSINFHSSNLSHAASPSSQLLIVPAPAEVTVQPVRFDVVMREKKRENFPGLRHPGFLSLHKWLCGGWSKWVVLYCHEVRVVIVSNVNFPWFPFTNIFKATRSTDFLADHNVMSFVGRELAFHFEHKTFRGLSLWNVNLNQIINICTNNGQGRSKYSIHYYEL